MADLLPPPYPANVKTNAWRFELDVDRIQQSDTWALAAPDVRPWLLMMWVTAWSSSPCGSLPADEAVLCARIGMPQKFFAKHKGILMRGWTQANDGRMYHETITSLVFQMLEKRKSEAQRKAEYRTKKESERQTESHKMSHVTDSGQTVESTRNPTQTTDHRTQETSSLRSDVNVRDVFAEFWQAFPKKVGKGDAEKAWKKIQRPAETLALILEALAWQKVSPQWTKDGGQYVPNPSTYLNQKRWEDEPQKVVRMVENEARNLSFAERERLARQRRWEEMTNEKWPGDQPAAIDVMAKEVGGQHVIAA